MGQIVTEFRIIKSEQSISYFCWYFFQNGLNPDGGWKYTISYTRVLTVATLIIVVYSFLYSFDTIGIVIIFL